MTRRPTDPSSRRSRRLIPDWIIGRKTRIARVRNDDLKSRSRAHREQAKDREQKGGGQALNMSHAAPRIAMMTNRPMAVTP